MMALLLKFVGGSQLAASAIIMLGSLIAAVAVYGSGYWAGRAAAKATCQTAVLEADNKALSKALADSREIARRANDRSVTDAAELSTLRSQVEDLTHDFEKKGAACVLSPDDARRLRNIR